MSDCLFTWIKRCEEHKSVLYYGPDVSVKQLVRVSLVVHAKFDLIGEHVETCAERLNHVFALLLEVYLFWIVDLLQGYLIALIFFISECEILQCLTHMLITTTIVLDSCNMYTPHSTTHVALLHSSCALWDTYEKKEDQAYFLALEENRSPAVVYTVIAHDYTTRVCVLTVTTLLCCRLPHFC